MKGLVNIGNTCYLNSTLQLLLHNYDLCNLIVQNTNKSLPLNILSIFINDYYNNNSCEPIVPDKIKCLLENKNNLFKGFGQHDAGECLIYLLDLINNNININILYEIKTNISIKCKLKSCLNISCHEEINNSLFLDINESSTNLDDCYLQFIKKYKFENDNLYYCDKCRDKRIASKRTNIINYPTHLIVILKRFINNNGKLSKNTNYIDVPEIWLNNYHLKGIIFHSGNLYGGHYIYIGKNNNNWYMFNDNFINIISDLNNYKNYGYIYYFEKK